MNKIFYVLGLSGLLGVVGGSLFAAKYIPWYVEPGVPIGVSCQPSVHYAIKHLFIFQCAGLVIAWVIGLFMAYGLFKKKKPDDSNLSIP